MESKEYDDVDSLIKEYSSIYRGYQSLENTDQPSNSNQFQSKLTQLIRDTESLVHGVNKHSIFGVNENVEELPAEHLRFLLLPALLGYFTSKQTLVDTTKGNVSTFRQESIKKSQTYYLDFMRLCKSYGVEAAMKFEENEETSDTKKKYYEKDAFARKSEKVLRYKSKKSLDSQLQDLFCKLSLDHVDESTMREYYTKLIDQWLLTTEEELEFIEEELAILEHMSKLTDSSGDVPPPVPQTKPSRPFILTKNDIQKQVFGLGYPSVPTYTVEEFYDAQVRAGQLPPPGGYTGAVGDASEAEAAEQQEIVKEYNVENDDEETLTKAREWDDWKDDHRRGWGNRKNMG